jgi:Protein of unknown function (DUF1583)
MQDSCHARSGVRRCGQAERVVRSSEAAYRAIGDMTVRMSNVILRIVILGPGGLLLSAAAQQAGSTPEPTKPRLAVEFRQDFRDSKLDTRTMSRVGGDAEQFVRTDPAGLRIRIPAGLNNHEAVGIAPRCRVHGDFEITVSFTIVKADTPIRGYGVGASVWVETNTATNEALTIERGIIPKEGERFTSTRVSGYPLDRKYNVRRALATSRSGKLRMERVGTKVTTSYADGDKPFRVLRTVELGPEDVTLVRLAAETGVSDHSVEVLFEDLTIRADALPGLRLPASKAPATTPNAARGAQ